MPLLESDEDPDPWGYWSHNPDPTATSQRPEIEGLELSQM